MNANVEVKIERKIEDFFIQRLRNAKQKLWIMSPWVASEYMDLAVSMKTSGVDVHVITSNDYVNGQKDALSKLIEKKIRILKPENNKLKYSGLALIVAGIILIPVTKGVSLLGTIVGIVLYLIGRGKSETYWISKLGDGSLVVFQHHPYKMIHAKIYVADDTVIMGSANMTGNGFKHNIEAMATMQNADLATEVIGLMNNMKETSGLNTLSYDMVGRDIQYVEPRKIYYRKRSSNSFFRI
jgi:phosphatidylserine/phosphatidylglycerophosphate/cardiolipin synthase-like enzyme